jgi:4-amino-4-deoxy-L-arabinose transferase-like glycosyltransferase
MIASFTGLGIGESYYVRGAKYLQLSYFDQPPLFFWIGGLAIRLLGENTFALRLPTVLMFAGTTWFLYQIGKSLFGGWTGFFAALLMNTSFVFTVSVACWFQPDAPLMFFWLACTYCILQTVHPLENYNKVRILRKSYKSYFGWILTGVTLGLTSLSKYHAIFLAIGVFLFFLSHNEQRHWLWHPGPYIALLINFIFLLPVFIWNSQNDWISFVFQGTRSGSVGAFTLHFDWFFASLAGQAVWLLPWIWGPLVWQIPKLPTAGKAASFCFWTAICPILFFTVVALWRNPQGHFHWQAPGYMMLFIPLGSLIDKKFHQLESRIKLLVFG